MSTTEPRLHADSGARPRLRHGIARSITRVVCAIVATTVAACGDDVTAPDIPLTILVPASGVAPYQVLEANLGAGMVTQPTLQGTLGDAAITAARVSDSTVSFLVPPVPAGAQVLSFVTGGTTRKATLQVGTAPAVANPAVALDAIADRVDATIASQLALLAVPRDLGAAAGVDSAAMRTQLVTLQQKADAFRASLEALTPGEQAQVAAFFAANPALFSTTANASASANLAMLSASAACTSGKACYDTIDRILLTISVAGFSYVGVKMAISGAAWFGGVLSKITVEGLQIAAASALIIWTLNEIADMRAASAKALLEANNPTVIDASPFAMPAGLSLAYGQDLPPVRTGTASVVPVPVTYRSLTSGDLASDPEVSGIAKSFALVQQAFAAVAGMIPFYSVPAPAFPASPLTRVVQVPPPQQMAIGTISPAAFTATSSASGANWMVLFANDKQGADHRVNVQVKFTPPGLKTQTGMASVTVQPKVYRVAALAIDPPSKPLSVSSTLALAAVARDSTTQLISAGELGTRKPVWTSANPTIATVDAASGLVTGVAKGVARITAALEDGQAYIDLTVNETCDAGWVFGTWTATHLEQGGSPLPAWQDASNVSAMITSGSLTINADSTFTGSLSWWGTQSNGTGMYGPGGNVVYAPVDTRYSAGKLKISCTVQYGGVKMVQLETLAVTALMFNTGSTPAPQGFEGWGNSEKSNVTLYQRGDYATGELWARLARYVGVASTQVRLRKP